MLSLILSLWIAQSVPVLPLGTALAPEPAIAQQTAACCCGEKCECGAECDCQKSEDGKACCPDGCKCCSEKASGDGNAKAHACCGGHDQKTDDQAKNQKCCASGAHCKRDSKAGK